MPEITEVKEPTPIIVRKSEIDLAAEELRAKRELPKKPGDRVQFHELRSWLQLLSAEQLARLNIYVYRYEPIINRQLIDPEADNNIDVIYDVRSENITEQYFIETHGGGKYRLIIKDLDKPKVQKGGFFEATLYIPMTQYPPKLDLREVDWDNSYNKGFKSWARAQKLIDERGMPTIEKKQEAPGGSSDNMVQAMKLAMDFASKMDEKQQSQLKRQLGAEDTLGKSIGDILLEKMKQDDPNKQVATLTTLISAMKGMQPEQKATTSELSTIMPLLIAMMDSGKQQTMVLVESMKAQMTMLVEVMKSSKPEASGEDDTTRLKNLLEIARMMKGNAVPEKSLTESIVEAAGNILPQALQVVNNIMSLQAAKGMGNTGPMPTPTVIRQPEALPQPSQPQQNQQTQPTMTTNEKQNAIRQFGPLFLANLSKEGWEFASWISEGFPNGPTIVASIIKDGVADLIATIKSVPELWTQIEGTYGEDHLTKWVTSFVNYKEEIEKIQREEDEMGEEVTK